MTTDETTDTATETHDTESCTEDEILRLILRRKPEDDATEVEFGMHVHSAAEARTCLEMLNETEARLQAMVLLNRLQRALPSDLLDEMLTQLDAIVTGGTDEH